MKNGLVVVVVAAAASAAASFAVAFDAIANARSVAVYTSNLQAMPW